MLGDQAVPAEPTLGIEAVFRNALVTSVARLALADRNLLELHHLHRVGTAQLAAMFGSRPPAMARQLIRIRERVLRDVRRRLAPQLALDAHELDALSELARQRFDHAMARILRR